MSILIKGMEMPFCCLVCPCSGTDNTEDGDEVWICEVSELRQITTKNKIEHRPEWCPLVPVPPHGRLGDLDRLEQMFVDIDNAPYSGFDGTEPFYSAEDAAQIIRLAPTIIPADDKDINVPNKKEGEI